MAEVVLASSSPRRRALLEALGLAFEVRAPDIDESFALGESPRTYVRRLALEKAAAVARPGEMVIAADTTVDIDGEIVGKPLDADDARRMLRALSGRSHLVHTGVAVRCDDSVASEVESTEVRFTPLSDADIDWYVGTGEPLDKAGAYAHQGAAGIFVAGIVGSVSNVTGLPLTLVRRLCDEIGHPLLRL